MAWFALENVDRCLIEERPNEIPEAVVGLERAEHVREVPVLGAKELFDHGLDRRVGDVGRPLPECLPDQLRPIRVARRPVVQRPKCFPLRRSRGVAQYRGDELFGFDGREVTKVEAVGHVRQGELRPFAIVQHVRGAGQHEHVSRQFRLDEPHREHRANRARQFECGVGEQGADLIEEQHDAHAVGGTRALLEE